MEETREKHPVVDLPERRVDLTRSELLYRFDRFEPGDWSITRHPPKWQCDGRRIVGDCGGIAQHGQVFYREPVDGDVVLSFDAELVAPCDHDLVWFWGVRLDREPWGEGWLGCLGGWWANLAGIERMPDMTPSAIAAACPIETGRSYHVVSGTAQGRHFIAVDGQLVLCFLDERTAPSGHFGFGVYESCAAYSNLSVYRPFIEPRKCQYD